MARLEPIEHPRGALLRYAFRLSLKRFGKVIAPLRVIYARKPRLLVLAAQIQRTMEKGLQISPELRFLLQAQAARLNGCAFCHDITLAEAVRGRIGGDRFAALAEFRASPHFSERVRAALGFAEEATLHRAVSDATFATLRAHFSEVEIVEIAWVNAAENYFNLQAHPLGLESDGLEALAARR